MSIEFFCDACKIFQKSKIKPSARRLFSFSIRIFISHVLAFVKIKSLFERGEIKWFKHVVISEVCFASNAFESVTGESDDEDKDEDEE